jgi:DNA processing protein
MTTKDDLIAVLAACDAAQQARVPWWQVGRAAARLGSATALLTEPWEPIDRWEHEVAFALAHHLGADALSRWGEELAKWEAADPRLRFLTILEGDYPANLRVVFNPPPFLVLRGALLPEDARGVAVVGTRHASPEGIRRAHRLGRELGEAGITVFSGLAAGIDTSAHTGALAVGGRTVAVLGHGLLQPLYPKENRGLADEVAGRGALISQFRPDTPPTKATFPMRNVVTSGLSQGTIVVEASRTSGARMQARLAAEQGKRVWLLRTLVDEFDWARDFALRHPHEVRVVDAVEDVVSDVVDADAIAAAAAKGLPPVAAAEEARRGEPQQPQFALF